MCAVSTIRNDELAAEVFDVCGRFFGEPTAHRNNRNPVIASDGNAGDTFMVHGSIGNPCVNHFALNGTQEFGCWENAEPDKNILGPFPLQIHRDMTNPHRGKWRMGNDVFRWSFPADCM